MLTLPRASRTDRTPESLVAELRWAWSRSDRIFDLAPEALYERPIPLRHPLIFYVGHLAAFAWNHVARGLLGRPPMDPVLDELFERGIDPIGVDSAEEVRGWPPLTEVLAYRDAVRAELPLLAREAWSAEADPYVAEGRVLELVLEHELMHHETLLYILRELDHGRKRRPDDAPVHRAARAPRQELVALPRGRVLLGATGETGSFGWDNEFPPLEVSVESFWLQRYPVTVADFDEFVQADGYRRPDLWLPADHEWIASTGRLEPHGWTRDAAGRRRVRTLLEDVPFEVAAAWPAVVSGAEARAYARWRGGRLPGEAELHHAAFSTPDGGMREYPWGDEPPRDEHGNFDLRHLGPLPVGSCPAGRSALGVDELLGNVWQWTSTEFAARPGFRAIPSYPGYSADFFDDGHLVLFGGSWATDRRLLRRSFRNWFQPHYPYVLAGLRLAFDEAP